MTEESQTQQIYTLALTGMPVCLPVDMPYTIGEKTGYFYVKVRAKDRETAIKIAGAWGKVMDVQAKN
jgi:hypothetical protein